jgi:hypothetical protein
VYENYPYFGTVFRASGVCGGPTALVVISLLPLTVCWQKWRSGEGKPCLLLFFAPILLLTFSKEILLLVLAFFLVDQAVRRRKILWVAGLVAGALMYWFGTHYIVQPVQEFSGSYLEGAEYSSGKIVWRGEHFQLLETSYTAIKKAAWSVMTEHPLVGVGADQFPAYLPGEKAKGVYPEHLPDYIPHSTWFGAMAETGVLGFMFLLSMVIGIVSLLITNFKKGQLLPLVSFFIVFGIGAMSMDLLHLRFVWVPAGILLGWSLRKEISLTEINTG